MKLKTAMERYLFAAINSRREYDSIKFCQPHINESDNWKNAYEEHVRKYNFWINTLNYIRATDREIGGMCARMELIICG